MLIHFNMKQLFTYLFILIGMYSIHAQSLHTFHGEKQGKPAPAARQLEMSTLQSGLSAAGKQLTMAVIDQNKRSPITQDQSVRERFNITSVHGRDYVHVMYKGMADGVAGGYGVEVGRTAGEWTSGMIPVDQFYNLICNEPVEYISVGGRVKPQLDNARQDTKVDIVHTGSGGLSQSYTGKGVVMGVIDQGFDYTHPSFYDETYSTYRVSRIWNQAIQSGTPPQGYHYGAEYTTMSGMLQAGHDGMEGSHGTHVAGTAAGSGAGTDGLYRGVAYESELVLVPSTFASAAIFDAAHYIVSYAQSAGKPCVVNMSLGSHGGPLDGTDPLDQALASLSAPGQILVVAAGNSGDSEMHISKTLSPADTEMFSFLHQNGSAAGEYLVDIWGEPGDQFEAAVNIYDISIGGFVDYTDYVAGHISSSLEINLLHATGQDVTVEMASGIDANNGKPQVQCFIDARYLSTPGYRVLLEVKSANAHVHAWSVKGEFSDGGFQTLVGGDVSMTLGSPASSQGVLAVGAYTTKNQFTDLSGQTVNIDFPAAIGAIGPFSSHGPTADNRLKPEITAPGNVIVAPFNSFEPPTSDEEDYKTFAIYDNHNNWWYYGASQGTSMACPFTSGIIALWLEAYPLLDLNDVLALLAHTADTDQHTGAVPNTTWGWGKINALAGLTFIEQMAASTKNQPAGHIAVWPNPSVGLVHIRSEVQNVLTLEITDAIGRPVVTDSSITPGTHTLDIAHLAAGMYFVNLRGGGKTYSQPLILQH